MKAESDPITDDEWLLRLVMAEKFKADRTPTVVPSAFEPRGENSNHPDYNGISLFREACLVAPTDVLGVIDPSKHHRNGIVRVPVSLLKQHGFSVASHIDPRVPGHVVVPELNCVDYYREKSRYFDIKFALATIASEPDNILLRPGQLPPS
jgi:hypothetical protein